MVLTDRPSTHSYGGSTQLMSKPICLDVATDYIPGQILKQARMALDKASHIIFLIDGRSEITGADRDLALMLRKLGKPVSLAVNKVDSAVQSLLANEFYSLGIGDVYPISAEHSLGVDALVEHVTADFPRDAAAEAELDGEGFRHLTELTFATDRNWAPKGMVEVVP